MRLRAANEYWLDLATSYLVRDKGSDIAAGRAAGPRAKTLVLSGHKVDHGALTLTDSGVPEQRAAADWIQLRAAQSPGASRTP